MQFGKLSINDNFKRKGSELVWCKSELFKAHGQFIQNSSALFRHSKLSQWHFDFIKDEEEVEVVSKPEIDKGIK